MKKRAFTTGLSVVIFAAILVVLNSAVQYYYTHNLIEDELENHVLIDLSAKTSMLRQTLQSAELTMEEHRWDIQRHLSHPDSLFDATSRLIANNTNIIGGCLAFVPGYYPQKGRLFEPYAYKKDDRIVVEQLGQKSGHDYTLHPAYQWVLNNDDAVWSLPYEYKTDNGVISLTTYSYPIRDSKQRVVAVCGLDFSLEWLGDTLNSTRLYQSSFDLFLTRQGRLIAGPNKDSVSAERVKHVVELINDSTVKRTVIDNKRITSLEFFDEEIGESGCIYYTAIDDPQWQLVVVCYDFEVYDKVYKMRLNSLWMLLFSCLLIGFIIYRMFRNATQLKQVNEEKERIDAELHIAHKIQKQMLPVMGTSYEDRSDVILSCSLTPAKEVGGDLFDHFIRDEKLFFTIGDVSGKGIPSAMLMSKTYTLFRMATMRENNPARIMQIVNETSCQNNESNMFVTLFIGVLDLPTGRLRYCNAGHDKPILNGAPLPAKANLPVGVFDDVRYEMQEIQLPANALLFLYTDGLTEAKNLQHNQYGLARIENVLQAYAGATPQQLLETFDREVHLFMGDEEQSDDLTMMAIHYNRRDEEIVLQEELKLKNDVHGVPELNDFVKRIVEKLEIGAPLDKHLRLAVEEAVVNVMNYAYPLDIEGEIRVKATSDGHTIKFFIIDSGVAFDPTEAEKADTTLSAEDRPIGGLGILLVRQLMDSINYERVDGQNILTLIKNYTANIQTK
jgi:sigma-B regulation protein RsbU (phosphoserine phosphatase)